MSEEIALKKMYWHSRRGMLELDLILVPFVEKVLATLNPEQSDAYARLLDEEDPDIYQWLVQQVPAPNQDLQNIVNTILLHVQQE